MKRQVLVYDIETFINCFTITFYIRRKEEKDREYKHFIIFEDTNQYQELLDFLFSEKWVMVGFNNEGFDYPIIHHMINHKEEYLKLSSDELTKKLYTKAQSLINEDFIKVWDSNKFIPQIDLYAIWHFDNKARKTSLKDIEIFLNLELVEDMPFRHDSIIKKENLPEILSYNKNDVYATAQFFELTIGNTDLELFKGKNKLELRQKLAKKYNIPCINYNDIKLGVELILKMYCDTTGIDRRTIKQAGTTQRKVINVKDCLPPWTNFKTKLFKQVEEFFSTQVIYDGVLKDSMSFELIIPNQLKVFYGSGGVHASANPGVYNANENQCIIDLDLDSQYPSLNNLLGLYPKHLGKEYLNIYKDKIVDVRISEKKKPKGKRDLVIVEGFKLAANGAIGKYNDEQALFYDPLCNIKVTCAGQITLSMWVEEIITSIPEAKLLQLNTDGLTVIVPCELKDKVKEISDNFTKSIGMTYEINEYSKVVMRDVNNYAAKYTNGKIKYKGDFEIEREPYKDTSMKIVRIALREYFFNNTPIKDTIRNHKNIYDFCLRLKTDSRFIPECYYWDKDTLQSKELTKTTRYYVANTGCALQKRKNHDGTGNEIVAVNKGYVVQIFNKYEDKINFEDYNINYSFYENETLKIINTIEDRQLSLF